MPLADLENSVPRRPLQLDTERALQIANNPTSEKTNLSYNKDMKEYEKLLIEAGIALNDPDTSCNRNKRNDALEIACALVLKRCGPKHAGYEGLKP